MRTRKRDPSFLRMAALAAFSGTAAIALSIGIPLWQWRHGQPYRPAFSLFAGWGIAALCGSYACWRTYVMTDPAPPRLPGGGVRLEFRQRVQAPPAPATAAREGRAA